MSYENQNLGYSDDNNITLTERGAELFFLLLDNLDSLISLNIKALRFNKYEIKKAVDFIQEESLTESSNSISIPKDVLAVLKDFFGAIPFGTFDHTDFSELRDEYSITQDDIEIITGIVFRAGESYNPYRKSTK